MRSTSEGKKYLLVACLNSHSNCFLTLLKHDIHQVDKSFAVSASSKLIACACSNGIVQLFDAENLQCGGSLVYSRSKQFDGASNIVYPMKDDGNVLQNLPALPDAIACYFSTSEKLGAHLSNEFRVIKSPLFEY